MHVVCLNNWLIVTIYFLQKFLFYVSFSRKSLFKLFEWKHTSISFNSQKIMFYSVTIPAYFSLNSWFRSNRIIDVVIYRSNNWNFYRFCQRATRKTHSSFFIFQLLFWMTYSEACASVILLLYQTFFEALLRPENLSHFISKKHIVFLYTHIKQVK